MPTIPLCTCSVSSSGRRFYCSLCLIANIDDDASVIDNFDNDTEFDYERIQRWKERERRAVAREREEAREREAREQEGAREREAREQEDAREREAHSLANDFAC